MRNLKRALSLVMAMALIVGMMVVSASAVSTKDFTDGDEIQHPEAVNTLVALNVISGKEDGSYYDPTGTLTRAEMAKIVAYVMNGGVEPNIGTKVVPTYSDIDNHWAEAYIEYCTSMNIIAGDGAGKFNPNGTLTASQTAKMFLTAMGYDANVFGLLGNDWETNTNRYANEAGLYDGLGSLSVSAPISRDDAAQMAYNAIQAALMVRGWSQDVTTGNITERYELAVNDDGEPTRTLFSERFGGKIFVGSFDGNSEMDSLSLRDGYVQITGALTTDDTSASGWTDKVASFPYELDIAEIGEEFKVIYKEGTGGTEGKPDRNDTIYGVYNTGATEVLNVTADDINDNLTGASNAGKVEIDDVKYDVAASVSGEPIVVKNYGVSTVDGTAAESKAETKSAIQALYAQKGDAVKFIFDENGEICKAYVTESKLGTVTAVNSEKITISGLGSITIADNEIYEDVARNDVVVYTQMYNSTLSDAYVVVTKAEVISGEVTGYKGTETVTVDGTTYKIYNKASMPNNVAGEHGETSFTTGDIGETFDLYMVNGMVGAVVQTSETATNYSLVIDINGGTVGSTLNALRIVALGADGAKTTLTVSDTGDTPELGDIITWTGSADDAKVNVEADKDSFAEDNSVTTGYNNTSKTFNGIVTSSDAVLFRATDATFSAADETSTYKVYNIRNLKTFAVTANDYTYVTNDDGMVVAVFVGNEPTISTSTSDAVVGIVSASNGVVEFDDVEYNQYVVSSNSDSYTVNIEKDGSNDTLTKGNIVAFAPSTDNLYADNTGIKVLSSSTYNAQDVTTVIDTVTYEVSTIYVKNYDESQGLLTYYTGRGPADSEGAFTSPTGTTTKAVSDEVTIVYVDVDNDAAGDEIGVNAFDAMSGYKNAMILVDTDDVITHIVVETSNTNHVWQ